MNSRRRAELTYPSPYPCHDLQRRLCEDIRRQPRRMRSWYPKNVPPSTAASHTSSQSSSRVSARMIVSLVALSAAYIREMISRCCSRSKILRPKETFSTIRSIKATISSVKKHASAKENRKTPMLDLSLIIGTAAEALTPWLLLTSCQGRRRGSF